MLLLSVVVVAATIQINARNIVCQIRSKNPLISAMFGLMAPPGVDLSTIKHYGKKL